MTAPTKSPIAVFGGSFDPPHVGHVLAVHYILLTTAIECVLVIPCGEHAFGKGSVDFEHRLAMCRLAFADLAPGAVISGIEGRRAKRSYTIDTIRELRRVYPGHPLELVVGSDIVEEMDQWKDIEALREMVSLRVLPRLGEAARIRDEDASFFLPRISSTTIRRMIAREQDITPHVPRKVRDYIQQHQLYKT